ncbi:hypothetical protein ABH942_000124 [Flavobacterium sp. 28YEA47A]
MLAFAASGISYRDQISNDEKETIKQRILSVQKGFFLF